jgi:hypothetical protein
MKQPLSRNTSLFEVLCNFCLLDAVTKWQMADIEAQLLLRYANEEEPLPVDQAAVQFYSTCASGLPTSSERSMVWDLSSLQCDVSRTTVLAWLNVVYKQMRGAVRCSRRK